MPGPIMTAKQAVKKYGKKYKSIREVGSVVMLKNSDGRIVQVPKGQSVYHRTKGKFGIYTTEADIKRRSEGAGAKVKKPIGSGPYRHTDDRKAKPIRKTGKKLAAVRPTTKEPAYVAKLKAIVKNHQYKKIGGTVVDVQTANLILKVRKKLNPTNLAKYDKLSMIQRARMSWKMV